MKAKASERSATNGSKRITRHTQLEVYQRAFAAAMRIFELTKTFPKEERYSLVDQIRRASRSVCSNLAEAWRKRRYEGAFVCNLTTAKAKPPRRRSGFSSPSNVDTWTAAQELKSTGNTTRS